MNHYRLPRQSYKCGHTPTGDPCPLGPFHGRCSQSHSDPSMKVCRPLRTLVWWNRSIQVSATLLALIGVSLNWSNLGGKQSIAPGPLSLSHAQLLVSAQTIVNASHGMDAANRCASCHPANQTGSAKQKQSDLCLKCHLQKMPDAAFGSPHDLQGKSLDELVAKADHSSPKSSLAKLFSGSPIAWKDATTECSQCHREHRGSGHNLKEMTSARCQACHRDQFHSFSTDHPEFKNYPYGRTKNIEFDHVKHRDMHFSKKATNFDCKSCHVQSDQVGAVGQVFRSVSFEQACASCHTEPIKSSIQDGLIVLQIPSLNRKVLLKAGADIGTWPAQASQLTDGVLPPIMQMLIESEPGGLALLNDLPSSGRLVEIDLGNELGRDTLLKLTVMTKQLFQKLANEGQPGFRSSVEKLISTSAMLPSDSSARQSIWLDRFANGIPPDLFRAAWNEWFNDGKTESVVVQSFPGGLSPVRLSSNLRSADDDLLLGNESPLLNSADENLLTNDNVNLSDSQGKSDSVSELFKDTRAWDQLAFGGWMIDRQRMAIVYVPRGHADEWLSRWIELEEMKSSGNRSNNGIGQQHRIEFAKQCRQCHDLKPSNQSNETLYHANWTVSFRNANQSLLSQELLVAGDASNKCWKSKRRAANVRQFTKFDHTPHLALPKISDCRSCHVLESKPTFVAQDNDPIGMDPPLGEFAPMKKDQCASCHQPNAAGQSCTQCHNYHVGINGWHGGRE